MRSRISLVIQLDGSRQVARDVAGMPSHRLLQHAHSGTDLPRRAVPALQSRPDR